MYVYMIMSEKARTQTVTCFVNWNLQKLTSDWFYFIQIGKQVSGLRKKKIKRSSLGDAVIKNPSANSRYVRDVGSIPGLGRSP